MKSNLLIFFVLSMQFAWSQSSDLELKCGTDEKNAEFFKARPDAHKEYLDFNRSIRQIKGFNRKGNNEVNYTIPVVFHVFGKEHNGKTIDNALIEQALIELNKDFQGLNDDFNDVHDTFKEIRGSMNISFKLAKKDPQGEPTAGINYYEILNGFGQENVMDDQIKEHAWDNYKYMNVYIQNDLYNDGAMNNSGVAWYPNTNLSDQNLARVVYNGAFIGTNTNKEFASVLSHEFGHWLNLIHTFHGGCDGTDEVDDTPVENGNHDIGCSIGTNCDGVYVNFENYMGYNGAKGCYKMFTAGQIERMIATMEHDAIKPLWQDQNLIDTGVKNSELENISPTIVISDPINETIFTENNSVTVKTVVNDENGIEDIAYVEFYFDEILESTVNFDPFTHVFKDLTPGLHSINVVVFDKGGLSDSDEISIEVSRIINYPEVMWITNSSYYLQNNTEFATGEEIRRIEIIDYLDVHDIIVKGPNDFEQRFKTVLNEPIILENLAKGTWTIEIPDINKKLQNTFE